MKLIDRPLVRALLTLPIALIIFSLSRWIFWLLLQQDAMRVLKSGDSKLINWYFKDAHMSYVPGNEDQLIYANIMGSSWTKGWLTFIPGSIAVGFILISMFVILIIEERKKLRRQPDSD